MRQEAIFYPAAALVLLTLALRVGHSAVHITYNNVFHRLGFFAASYIVLAVLWILVFIKL